MTQPRGDGVSDIRAEAPAEVRFRPELPYPPVDGQVRLSALGLVGAVMAAWIAS